ncbi:MAG: hypothetical protein M3P43_05055 [Actinomycetota bacterium]|nr:hypothetical protein [Actinomycetota bacterium]
MRSVKRVALAIGSLLTLVRGRRTHSVVGGGAMKTFKRIAVASASLLALVFAGGAHWRW